ncbi:flagellar export chaperone FliS [Methylophaga thiooxydans]|uniref:flagellar export chaperone FliS n=1 Tax=Methylophaga thiooxydans TaxID=392484 RepID=UPI0023542714|nr:flagellar export chaperone FliS [Methylophaga thiooxydans]
MKKGKDMNNAAALNAYRTNHVEGGVATASPHRLVQMLMDGVQEKLIAAKGFMASNQIAKKGETISWAITIIDSLRACLNTEAGGEVAENLQRLYDYMEVRLLEANLKNDPNMIDEVGQLMAQVKAGWDSIPAEHHG